jgi:EpsI family protein
VSALWRYWLFLGSQGVLICALAGWLLWRARNRIGRAVVAPRPWLALVLLLCSTASLVFWKAGIQALDLVLLPVILLLAISAAFGSAVARVAAVPVLYFYFAMPGWNLFSPLLQNMTLRVISWVSPILGLPATVSGSTVAFPNGATFEVTSACSGIGFLVQALAIGVLLGELEQSGLKRRFKLLFGATLVALLANWVRAIAILYIGYSTDMRSPLALSEHLTFGYALFVLALVIYVWVVTRNAPPDADVPQDTGIVQPRWSGSFFTTILALAAAPIFVAISASAASSPALNGFELPPGREGWSGPQAVGHSDWNPSFVGRHDESHVAYSSPAGSRVEVIGIGYDHQEQGRELVNEDNSLTGDDSQLGETSETIDHQGTRYLETVYVDKYGRQSVIWYFYDIGGRSFTVPLMSQLWYGLHSLRRPPYSALIAMRSSCETTCAEARATLLSFVGLMGPGLKAAPLGVRSYAVQVSPDRVRLNKRSVT